jgi:hypothetical protein
VLQGDMDDVAVMELLIACLADHVEPEAMDEVDILRGEPGIVRTVLLQPFAWEELKRALRAHELRIEWLGQMLNPISTVSLEPEPIPLAAKVVLLGEPMLYYQLYQADPEFGELFKVAADFEDQMDRTPEDEWLYARLIATLACGQGLRPSQPHHGAPCGGGGRRTAARAGVAGA